MKIFLRKFFVSQYRKILQVNPSVLCFRKFPVANKFMDERGGGVSKISLENFCLKVPEKFAGEPFSVSLVSGIEIFSASEGYVMIFRQKFLVSQYRKTS